MSDDVAAVAHLYRRVGFGPTPGELEARGPYGAALEAVLATAVDDGVEMADPGRDNIAQAVVWWLQRLSTSESPLYDKLVLFWHSHLPSSRAKVNEQMLARQHNLLRRHAMGNFRALIHGIVRDPAMVAFLDGSRSQAAAPNENFARELMELFTLGRGHYTEVDVRAGAKALAGLVVHWDSATVSFDETAANSDSLTILGVTDTFDAARFVDVICDHPACARLVSRKLYRYFVGVEPTSRRLDELATTFRGGDLEMRPLVESILRGADFLEHRNARARFPVEWFVAAHRAFEVDVGEDVVWRVGDLGQMPMYPPNVAGWQIGPEWFGAGRQLARASLALALSEGREALHLGDLGPADRADAALVRCGLFEVSPVTRAALISAAERVTAANGGDRLLVALALAAPEAACA